MRSAKLAKLLEESGARYRAAPIVERFGEIRDVFERDVSIVSVELTHGTWSTFARRYSISSESTHRAHPSREAARAYAREWLSR